MKRQPGSVRFAPYFKLQQWVRGSIAWVDFQKAYPSEEEARAAAKLPGRYRVMRVAMDGRGPVAEFEL
jgi:hypothetical protein